MKKSNLVKLFSILLMSIMVMLFSTNVLAADESNGGFNQLTLNNSTNNNTNSNSNTTNNNNNNANTNSNSSNNTNTNTNRNSNSTNNTNNANNTNSSSVYNNTNLPKTGIEDSIPVAMLVVVFGISAIYAYKKIKDYRNI